MIKNTKLIYLSLVLGGVVALSAYFGLAFAITNPINQLTNQPINPSTSLGAGSLPIGIHAEEIDGMVHEVEYHYGSPMFYSVDGMLDNKSVEVYPEDRVSYFPDPALGIGSQIVIKRASQVVVVDAGKEVIYRTWKNNVNEFLAEKNISLGEMDITNYPKDQNFSNILAKADRQVVARDGRENASPAVAKIEITRVAMTEIKTYEDISYKTVTKEDSNLERGVTKTEQEGVKGKKELVYEVRRENGQEVGRKLIKTNTIKDPQEKIIIKGTKVVVFGTGTATWYGLIGGMTAAHNTLPKGTMVHVVNVENGKSVDVKIVDRGIQGSAIIDLSDDAFRQIAPLSKGVVQVRLEKM